MVAGLIKTLAAHISPNNIAYVCKLIPGPMLDMMSLVHTLRRLILITLSVATLLVVVPVIGFAAEPIWVVGHKNPDTDAIVSAISVAQLKTALGQPALPKAQGAPNPETAFLLKRFNFAAPPIEPSFKGQSVILVDHADYDQAPDDIRQAKIIGIIDHHKLGGIETNEPLEVIMRPYGCANTIIFEMFQQNNVTIDPSLAGIMLGAILSDTRIFRSPTTTDADRKAAKWLAEKAAISDLEFFGREMLDAYTAQMRQMNSRDLITMDMKTFKMGSARVAIAQIESFDLTFAMDRISSIRQAMNQLAKEQKLDAFILALTDVGRQGSLIITAGPKAPLADAAYRISTDQKAGIWMDGVMSRKKQLVPPLQKAFLKAN